MSIFNQLLAALSGGAQGYAKQTADRFQRQRQIGMDAEVTAENASQRALRDAQIQNIQSPPETWGDAEDVVQNGQPIRVLRSNRGNVRPIGGVIPPKPSAPLPNTPEWQAAERFKASLRPPPTASFSFPTVGGPDGPMIARADNRSGKIELTDVAGKAPASAGAKGTQSATSQLQQGRMLAAVSEARLADERMRAFEDQLLAGRAKIGPVSQAAGNLTSNLAGSHSVVGAALQSASELGLNTGNPEYAQYLRDASTIGRAEQMIMPRGGTETMVRANSLLARAGTGAPKATIEASRMARQALFGAAGGLAQAMSPKQVSGLEEGLQKIKETGHAGRSGGPGPGAVVQPQQGGAPSGNVDLRGAPPPLSDEDKAHAARDPGFAAWLKSQGYP